MDTKLGGKKYEEITWENLGVDGNNIKMIINRMWG
jgi:hypothetical protein